jgi:hypothetical protein
MDDNKGVREPLAGNLRIVVAMSMLAASLAVLILPIYGFIRQMTAEATEFTRFILAIPTWALMVPGVLCVAVVLFTAQDAIRHRGQ